MTSQRRRTDVITTFCLLGYCWDTRKQSIVKGMNVLKTTEMSSVLLNFSIFLKFRNLTSSNWAEKKCREDDQKELLSQNMAYQWHQEEEWITTTDSTHVTNSVLFCFEFFCCCFGGGFSVFCFFCFFFRTIWNRLSRWPWELITSCQFEYSEADTDGTRQSLRKHAYSNIQKTLPP